MVERQIGLDITSGVGDKPKEGGNPQAIQMQNTVPAEIFNSESPVGERPLHKTPQMRKIENQHNGTPIDSILYDLHWVQNKSTRQIGRELNNKSGVTIGNWFGLLGVEIRSARDGVLARYAQGEPRKISAVRNSPTPTEKKLVQVKERFEIESDDKVRVFFEEMYKQYKSLGAMVKAFRDSGIKVGERIVKNWMLYFEIEDTLLEEHKKSIVKKAVENGDFGRITPQQQYILQIRGYLGEKPLVPFRKLTELKDLGITFQSASDTEVRAFRRLENGGVRWKIKPEERRFIQEHPSFPVRQLAVMFGRKPETMIRYKRLILRDVQ